MSEMEEVAGIDLIDVHSARESAHPHVPHIVPVSGVDRIIAKAGGVDIIMKVMPESVGIRVIDIDAGIFQSDPELVLKVFAYAVYDVAGEAFFVAGTMIKMLEGALRAGIIHAVQAAAIGADPKPVTAVLIYVDQLIAADGRGIIFFVREVDKGAGLFIEQVKPVAVCSQPEIFFAVDVYVTDIVAAQAGGVVIVVLVLIELIAVGEEIDGALVLRADE